MYHLVKSCDAILGATPWHDLSWIHLDSYITIRGPYDFQKKDEQGRYILWDSPRIVLRILIESNKKITYGFYWEERKVLEKVIDLPDIMKGSGMIIYEMYGHRDNPILHLTYSKNGKPRNKFCFKDMVKVRVKRDIVYVNFMQWKNLSLVRIDDHMFVKEGSNITWFSFFYKRPEESKIPCPTDVHADFVDSDGFYWGCCEFEIFQIDLNNIPKGGKIYPFAFLEKMHLKTLFGFRNGRLWGIVGSLLHAYAGAIKFDGDKISCVEIFEEIDIYWLRELRQNILSNLRVVIHTIYDTYGYQIKPLSAKDFHKSSPKNKQFMLTLAMVARRLTGRRLPLGPFDDILNFIGGKLI